MSSTLAGSSAARAWTPESQIFLVRQAVKVAPKDLRRQLLKHMDEVEKGVLAPFKDGDPAYHQRNETDGQLHLVLQREVERTVAAIKAHKPFKDIAYQVGVVAHYVAQANNPLNTSNRDASEKYYYADFRDYLESTEDRLEVVFYGLDRQFETDRRLGGESGYIERTVERSRDLYDTIGKEYRRINKLPGRRYFDDRSSAFGTAALMHSRAVTTTAQILRYLWIEAGGGDWRPTPHDDEGRIFLIPKDEPQTGGRGRSPR
ncbi:MAG: hypothetical protein AAGK22_19305 [Acidobacteriota bacterium]